LGGQTNSKKYNENGVLLETNIPVCHESMINPYFHEDFLGGNYDGFLSKIYFYECFITELLDCPTSDIDEILNITNKFQIIPNPVIDKLSIQLDIDRDEVGKIQILDMTGKVVLESKFQKYSRGTVIDVPVDILPSGVYQVTILATDAGTFVKKFIKF
jgi:hypothetical protein